MTTGDDNGTIITMKSSGDSSMKSSENYDKDHKDDLITITSIFMN